MVIKLENNNVVIKGKDVELLMVTKQSTARKYDSDIVLSSKAVDVEDSFLVSNPGEYEIKDIFVYALDTNESDEPNIFTVLIDDVQVVYLNADTKSVDKSIVEQIGMDNILLMDFVDDVNLIDRLKLVSAFDPGVFIPISNDDELSKKIANELGVPVPDRESKYKFSDVDFADSEKSMELLLFS